MNLTRLEYILTLPISLEKAWDFFSDPNNLAKITPKEMSFTVTSKQPEKVYAGLIITYIIKPLLGIPVTWVTEISQVKENEFFIDEQRFGPYKFWHHQHFFKAVNGGVEMTDIVHYSVPFGIIGTIMNKLLIKKKVENIFKYRKEILTGIFK
jgi:ligand-binding SRPBCC domain-containing protein